MVAQVDKNFIALSLKKTCARLLSYALYEGRPLTTKGRWINPLIFILFRFQSLLPFGKRVNKPIFILGVGRSGTTILGVTMGMHKDVGFLNEPKALWSYVFEREDLVGSYNDNKALYRLYAEDADRSVVKKAHRLYGWFLRLSCASRIVDKYPELIFRTGFVSEIFPDARYLFLYRNGHDTCDSIRQWSKRLGVVDNGETHDWWGKDDRKWLLLCEQIVANDDFLGQYLDDIRKYSDHVHRAAIEWIVTMKEGLRLMEEFPDSVMGVKYEDYVSSNAERDKVLLFCNLAKDKLFENYCSRTLHKRESHLDFNLPVMISEEFNRVMQRLGY